MSCAPSYLPFSVRGGVPPSFSGRSSVSDFGLSYDATMNATSGSSAWERFLRCAGVSENSCASHVARGTRQGSAIRSWVEDNYAKRYVPEHILEALGLRRKLLHRWQGDEQHGLPSAAVGEAH